MNKKNPFKTPEGDFDNFGSVARNGGDNLSQDDLIGRARNKAFGKTSPPTLCRMCHSCLFRRIPYLAEF